MMRCGRVGSEGADAAGSALARARAIPSGPSVPMTSICRRRESSAIEANSFADLDQLARRLARLRAASAADMQPQVFGPRPEAPFQRADHGGGDAGGMPVHAHHRAKRLEPEGMRETPQKLIAP